MPISRRAFVVFLTSVLTATLPLLAPPSPAAGQAKAKAAIPPQPAPPPPPRVGAIMIPGPQNPQLQQPNIKPGTKFSAIKLVEDEEFQKNLDQAVDAIEGGDWLEACDYLQAILDSKRDVFARVEAPDPKTGATKSHMVSVKLQANNLLASMPAPGLQAYEVKFGAQAKQLLDQAKRTGSREMLAEAASRFRHTNAGTQANELLATSFMDRGDYFPAALRFERLIGSDPANAKVSDLTLFKATLAFKRAGESYSKKSKDLQDVLLARVKTAGGLSLANGQVVSLRQVQAVLNEAISVAAVANPHDWPMDNGNLARNAQARGSPPLLDYVLWSRATLMDKSDETGADLPGMEVKEYFDVALAAHLKDPTMPVMPGGSPIATGGILFYRTYSDITAVYLHDVLDKDGKVEAKAGEIHWRSTPFDGALGNIFADKEMQPKLQSWMGNVYTMPPRYDSILFENSTVGTLTTDNRTIYAVDDLALPIPPKYLNDVFWGNSTYLDEKLKKLVTQNRLRAFDIPSGKVAWELGGDPNKNDDLANSHFLCAPIAIGGKLYVLNEKNSGDLRLVCIETAKSKADEPQEKGASRLVTTIQQLGTVKKENSFFHDISRRVNAIHLAYAEGILVCPTNAGEILGIDLMSQSLAWAYKYRDKPPNPQAIVQPFDQNPRGPIAPSYSNWKASPPVIVDGKVVFTAPDSSAVCCINLHDGSEVWTSPRQDTDVFFAGVYLDKVLVVGKNTARALRLADGTQAWYPLATGELPSGRGVASNNVYYLPLKTGEICSIDLEHWRILAHNRASKADAKAPGNLIFCEDVVLSQTPTAIVAYPQLVAQLEEAESAYKKDGSPKNLLRRGELRLANGEIQKAVVDLSKVLADHPPADIISRTRERLYAALSELLQVDFANAAPKHLSEYKELTKVPANAAEQLRREAKYWRIVGRGREAQGDLVQAFLAYKTYGASPLFKDDGIPSLEDPLHKVPANLWLRGRISAMFVGATAKQRADLDKCIAEEWQAVKAKNDLDAIRQFTGMFDVPVAVGREARLELANLVIQNKSAELFLEAELSLQQLLVPTYRKDPQIGGRALETLALLEMAKGTEVSLRRAAVHYRALGTEFAKVIIRDGKTGADLAIVLTEDPRLRPFLEEPGKRWSDGEIKHRELKIDDAQGIHPGQRYVFEPAGDFSPLIQQHRLVLDFTVQNNPVLHWVDTLNNKDRWSTPLGASTLNYPFFANLYSQTNQPTVLDPRAEFRMYHVKGHLAVVQIGMDAYGVDLDAGKVLWRHTLYDPNKGGQNIGNWQLSLDELGRLWVLHLAPLGQQVKARVGQIGTVQATYVALVTQKGLVVLDPLKGTPLWTKSGFSTDPEIFGDDQYIYYIDTFDGRPVGAGRCLRASDGEPVEIPDFGPLYRKKQRVFGGQHILTAEPNGKSVAMRLYDVPTGKTIWSRTFDNDPAVLHTEDVDQCGVIERDTGKLILLNAHTGQQLVTANMKQFRIEADDLKSLDRPVLLDDGVYYFVALNVANAGLNKNLPMLNSQLLSNFSCGTCCLPVNGWFCCLDHKGEFLWHGNKRLLNQMIVVEQFRMLPVLLFSSRYREPANNAPPRFVSQSGSLNKSNGKEIWWSPEEHTTGPNAALYLSFSMDLQAGTIDLVGYQNNKLVVQQHYLADK